MSNAFVFSKSRFLVVLSVFLLSVFQTKSQERKSFDFSLAGSIGGVIRPTGTDERQGGVIMNIGPEFVFPKLNSAIEFRLGKGTLVKSKELTAEANYRIYKVDMFSYGLVYKYLFYITEERCFMFENEFSWANLNAKITEGNYTPNMKNYFFYTFRLGHDVKIDDFIRLMPWVGLSSLNMKPLLNKPQHPFGGEDFPITFGLTIKIF